MALTFRRDGEFKGELIYKGGQDWIGVTLDCYKGEAMLGCRVWRATGGPGGECHSMTNGINLRPMEFCSTIPFINFILEGKYTGEPVVETQFPMSGHKFFRVNRQSWCGRDLVAARVWNKNKDGSERPTGNGLTIRPDLWLKVIPILKSVLLDITGYDVDVVSEEFENFALSRLGAK
jgi:hypothetical protein